MPATHLQLQLLQQGGSFATATVPTPAPEADEVVIQNKAIALNPIDNKQRDHGLRVESWPAVIGIEAAGVVTAVGSNVTRLQVGDEVMSTNFFAPKTRAFQEVSVLNQLQVAKKPAKLSFEEASSLCGGYMTALVGIGSSLKIPLPFVQGSETEGVKPSSVLVLGGSSTVGAAAIQLLRLSLPDTTILTTSSAKYHDRLKSLGANHAFDQNSPTLVQDIKAATPGGKGVEVMLDCVAGTQAQPAVFDAFDPAGPKIDAEIMTGYSAPVPDGVTRIVTYGSSMLDMAGREDALAALTRLLEAGEYRLPAAVKVVGHGLAGVAGGLAELAAGVSNTKLVVLLQ